MVKKYIIIIMLLVFGFYLFATEQISDRLIYNGRTYSLFEGTMELYFFEYPEKRPQNFHSALYRGYIATFEIIQNELWVVDIEKYDSEITHNRGTPTYVSFAHECFDGKDRMKVDWFSGLLFLPQRKYFSNLFEYLQPYRNFKVMVIQNGYFMGQFKMSYRKFNKYAERNMERHKEKEESKKMLEDNTVIY